jgi:hypothetical protein
MSLSRQICDLKSLIIELAKQGDRDTSGIITGSVILLMIVAHRGTACAELL